MGAYLVFGRDFLWVGGYEMGVYFFLLQAFGVVEHGTNQILDFGLVWC